MRRVDESERQIRELLVDVGDARVRLARQVGDEEVPAGDAGVEGERLRVARAARRAGDRLRESPAPAGSGRGLRLRTSARALRVPAIAAIVVGVDDAGIEQDAHARRRRVPRASASGRGRAGLRLARRRRRRRRSRSRPAVPRRDRRYRRGRWRTRRRPAGRRPGSLDRYASTASRTSSAIGCLRRSAFRLQPHLEVRVEVDASSVSYGYVSRYVDAARSVAAGAVERLAPAARRGEHLVDRLARAERVAQLRRASAISVSSASRSTSSLVAATSRQMSGGLAASRVVSCSPGPGELEPGVAGQPADDVHQGAGGQLRQVADGADEAIVQLRAS